MSSADLTIPTMTAPAPRAARLGAALGRWLDDFEQRRRRHRQLSELRGLDSQTLKDIGLDRSELGSAVATGCAGRKQRHDAR